MDPDPQLWFPPRRLVETLTGFRNSGGLDQSGFSVLPCLPAGPFCEGPGERGPTTCNRPIRRGLMARGFPQTTGSNPLNKKYSFLLSWSIFWEGYEGHERVLGSHTHHVKTRTRPSSHSKPREQYPWTRPPPLKVPYAKQFKKDSVTRF